MIRRISPWLLLMVLLVVGGAVIGVLAYRRAHLAASAADLMSCFPSSDAMVLAIDVRALRNAGVLDLVAGNSMTEESDYKTFVEQTGFDYRQDLDFVLIAFGRDETLMFLRGNFDWGKLYSYALAQQGACRNTFCRLEGSRPERRISFYPLRRDTLALAVGKDEWAATRLQGGPKSKPSFPVPNRPIWLSLPASALKNREDLPAGTRLFAMAMQDAERAMLSLDLGAGGMEADLEVTCKTASDAAILTTQLQGVTAALRGLLIKSKQAPNPHDLSGVLVGGSFWSEERRARGRWPVPAAFVEALAGAR